MDGSHIVYYEKTGKYVANVTSKFMSVMQADNFFGLYEFVHKTYKALKVDTGGFTLQFDEKSDIAYFIFEHLHLELATTTFSDNYTGKPTATVHKGSACVFQTKRRALFLHFGNKRILPESIKGGGI